MADVILYATRHCPYCAGARALLERRGVVYQEIDVESDPALRERMVAESGRHTVPQIFINGRPIGGYSELRELEGRGELDALLAG